VEAPFYGLWSALVFFAYYHIHEKIKRSKHHAINGELFFEIGASLKL
jgi:hypothetical protein